MGRSLEDACGFLVVADAPGARQTLRNICTTHEDAVFRRLGRAAVFEGTEFGAFLAFRLRAKHGDGVQIVQATPIGDRQDAFRRASEAARAFENRAHECTPYPKFAAGTGHPLPAEMRDRRLLESDD